MVGLGAETCRWWHCHNMTDVHAKTGRKQQAGPYLQHVSRMVEVQHAIISLVYEVEELLRQDAQRTVKAAAHNVPIAYGRIHIAAPAARQRCCMHGCRHGERYMCACCTTQHALCSLAVAAVAPRALTALSRLVWAARRQSSTSLAFAEATAAPARVCIVPGALQCRDGCNRPCSGNSGHINHCKGAYLHYTTVQPVSGVILARARHRLHREPPCSPARHSAPFPGPP